MSRNASLRAAFCGKIGQKKEKISFLPPQPSRPGLFLCCSAAKPVFPHQPLARVAFFGDFTLFSPLPGCTRAKSTTEPTRTASSVRMADAGE